MLSRRSGAMPMPVSVTSHSSQSRLLSYRFQLAATVTLPCSVNFNALPIRLTRICLMRVGSPCTSDHCVLPCIRVMSCRFFCLAVCSNTFTEELISCGRLNGIFSSSSTPRSMREKSRISLITLSRWSVDSPAILTYSLCSLLRSVVSSSCSIPSTPFIGVRSS